MPSKHAQGWKQLRQKPWTAGEFVFLAVMVLASIVITFYS